MGGLKAALSFHSRRNAWKASSMWCPFSRGTAHASVSPSVRCFHFRSLSVSSPRCLDFHNFVRLHRVQRSLVCRFLLHSLSQGLVDKREARKGDNGNEHRARAGSDGMEKERKGKPEVASWNVGYFLRLESRSSITPLHPVETRNRAPD